ncbi:MAG: O-antigen ligase family protein, partial [Nitrospirae bacterium]|nr:O-antigen ligase family protein [Candidatus Manganitrophaceae bacterium]
ALLFPVKSIASVTAGINLLKWFALYLPLFFWIAKMAVERKVGWVRTPLDLPLLLYTLLVLSSLAYSIDPQNTIDGIRGGYLKFVIVYLVVLHNFRTVEKLKRLATAFALSFLWLVAAGFYNYGMGDTSIIGGLAALGNRHHNVVGMFMGGTFPFLLLLYDRDAPLINRAVSGGLIVLGLFAVFLTLSRGTWLGVLVSFLIWGRFQTGRVMLTLSTAFALLVFLFGPASIGQRAELLKHQAGTISGRTPIWRVAASLIKERPLLGYGYGPGIFTPIYEKERRFHEAPEANAPHEHNLFVALLIQNGMVGLVLYLWILGGVVLLTFRTLCRLGTGPERELLIIVGSGVVGEYLVHALLERNHVGVWAIPFWAMMAITLVIHHRMHAGTAFSSFSSGPSGNPTEGSTALFPAEGSGRQEYSEPERF